jgi:exosortase
MSTTFAPAVSRPPRPTVAWAAAWTIVGAGAVVLFAILVTGVWPKRTEMGDRFLIPVASGILLYHLRPQWRAVRRASTPAGLVAVAVGAVGFAPAWYLLMQVGPRTILLWWLAAALTLASVGLVAAGHGWRRAQIVLFPLLFALFALPTPDTLQAWLLAKLKGLTTAGAAAVLPWLGVPAVRSGLGFTLTLPSGKLGVVDACSGALSLTSLLAIAVLTGYVRVTFRRDLTMPRAAALVVLTIPIVIASNTLRVIATGLLQENVGPTAIQGPWHEALGYMVILVGFGMIMAVSQKLAGPRVETTPSSAGPIAPGDADAAPPARRAWIAIGLLVPAVVMSIWAERFRQSHFEVANLDGIALALPGWSGTPLRVPPDVAEMLKCDQIATREYEDHLGNQVQVYFMFWATPASTAHIHHPDVCWPSRGCTLADGHVRPVTYAPGQVPIGVSVRHYDTEDGKREIVFYWTQNGNAVLPDGREPAGHGSEYGWVTDMLGGRAAPERVSRLSVLLGAGVPVGQPEDQEARVEALCQLIAAEVYRVCPWAAPTP